MRLGERGADGATERDHLLALEAQTGRADSALVVADVPRECAAVWEAYLTLAGQRRPGMEASPLVLVDIEAWCRMTGITLTQWELDTLLALDGATLRISSEQRRKRQEVKQ